MTEPTSSIRAVTAADAGSTPERERCRPVAIPGRGGAAKQLNGNLNYGHRKVNATFQLDLTGGCAATAQLVYVAARSYNWFFMAYRLITFLLLFTLGGASIVSRAAEVGVRLARAISATEAGEMECCAAAEAGCEMAAPALPSAECQPQNSCALQCVCQGTDAGPSGWLTAPPPLPLMPAASAAPLTARGAATLNKSVLPRLSPFDPGKIYLQHTCLRI